MNTRSSRSTVTFPDLFVLPGFPDELPAGEYEVVVEEELLQGVSFEAYRTTAIYLTIRLRGGRTEMRPITERDLEMALGHRLGAPEDGNDSEAALSPQEDLK